MRTRWITRRPRLWPATGDRDYFNTMDFASTVNAAK